jgi:hypothetical protein
MTSRHCGGCKETKLLSEFYYDTRNTSYVRKCKQCLLAAQKQWRKLHPDRAREDYRKMAVRIKYGLEPHQLAEMLARQNSVCAICGRPNNVNKNLAVDHCHATGAVRGLLCQNCNHGLGHFKDDPAILRKAVDYLEKRSGEKSENSLGWGCGPNRTSLSVAVSEPRE